MYIYIYIYMIPAVTYVGANSTQADGDEDGLDHEEAANAVDEAEATHIFDKK